jgi:hypothetical protein
VSVTVTFFQHNTATRSAKFDQVVGASHGAAVVALGRGLLYVVLLFPFDLIRTFLKVKNNLNNRKDRRTV